MLLIEYTVALKCCLYAHFGASVYDTWVLGPSGVYKKTDIWAERIYMEPALSS